jgi:hypothetical protein
VLQLSILKCFEEDFLPSYHKDKPHPSREGHRLAMGSDGPLHLIEVLYRGEHRRQRRESSRIFATSNLASSMSESSPEKEPDRIRIRSGFMLGLLEHITNTKLKHGGVKATHRHEDNSSLVFLHPFKFFVIHEQKIRDYTNKLKERLGSGTGSSTTNKVTFSPTSTANGEPSTPTGLLESPSIHRLSGQQSSDFRSEKAVKYLQVIIDLFDQHLGSILEVRRRFLDGTAETLRFEHLWLLFTVGELVYQRSPSGSTGQPGYYPPRMLRVTQFDGGRELLSNSEWKSLDVQRIALQRKPENSKGKENSFFIHSYSLDFDGDKFGPKTEALTIPHWDGLRNIHELKLFPIRFCRPGLEFSKEKYPNVGSWKQACVARGKEFCKLRQDDGVAVRHYKSQSQGEHKEQVPQVY